MPPTRTTPTTPMIPIAVILWVSRSEKLLMRLPNEWNRIQMTGNLNKLAGSMSDMVNFAVGSSPDYEAK
jgi:hypothetical protein